MEKKKVVFVLLALAGFLIYAAGGVSIFGSSKEGLLSELAIPLLYGNIVDTCIALVSLVWFIWALMPNTTRDRISRTQLLQGISLGSALIVCSCIMLCLQFQGITEKKLAGALGLIAILQVSIGLLAALLLFSRAESRGSSICSLLTNGGLCGIVIVLTHGQSFL